MVMYATFESVRAATGTQRPPGGHGCKPVEVVPGLWTAHFNDIQDRESLQKHAPGVNVVVNIAMDKCPTRPGSYGDGVEVVCIDLLDDPEELKHVDAMPDGDAKTAARAALPAFPPEECAGNAKKDFDRVADLIESTHAAGGATLVHCLASLSRSVAFILAYLMKKKGFTLLDAIETMKPKWSAVWPNDTFVQQLLEYEREVFPEVTGDNAV